ncbi:MAG: sigma-70 family RNA polymerase sigma factor [Armatimonadetes bacterium]|nr:sigma-70 family RNA polymerase sigma factor [Armatimonadota bacterium]
MDSPPARQDLAGAEDERLVVGALLGHLPAFDELVRRYRRAVTAVAESVLDSREAAEDVAQEAFLLAFKALPQLADLTRFGPWLYAITRHRARRVAAREQRHELTELDSLILEHSPALAEQPAAALLRAADTAPVLQALDGLPEPYRLALRLFYLDEWPVGRIADFLSVPVTTVKWRLHAGREKLRRELAEDQGEPDGRRDEGAAPAAGAVAARDRAAGAGCQPDRQHGGR